tara:strand:- start:197 stop:445 length:249 start_codon:yes stop_codon:yes gene_type:complete
MDQVVEEVVKKLKLQVVEVVDHMVILEDQDQDNQVQVHLDLVEAAVDPAVLVLLDQVEQVDQVVMEAQEVNSHQHSMLLDYL